MVKNETISNRRKEKFWDVWFKTFAVAGLFFAHRVVGRMKVRNYDDWRAELFYEAAKKTTRKLWGKQSMIAQWFVQKYFALIGRVLLTDNAYYLAYYGTIDAFIRLCDKHKLGLFRKYKLTRRR